MTSRSRHGWFLALAIPGLGLSGIWVLHLLHRWQAPESRALAWAVGAAGIHATLGWGLWKRASSLRSSGIAGGLSILTLRFLAGAGLVATGIVANPGMEKVFVVAWSGIFLILLVSESIFFVQGVQEL